MRPATVMVVAAAATTTVWVPIKMGGSVQYFNPADETLVGELPPGAAVAPTVSFLAESARTRANASNVNEDDEGEDDAPADFEDHKSCYPKCTWSCKKPVCEQDCKPQCEQPRCQTRCPKPDYNKCAINCQEPHCAAFCPREPCKENPQEMCSSPKCDTQCASPSCLLKCQGHVPCENVCHPPKCSWNCRNPKQCAKPECRMVCEKPMGCAQNYRLPPLSPHLTVQQTFEASRAKWIVYDWSECGMACGKSTQTRKVVCSTGEDHECVFSPKPATVKECEDLRACNKWLADEWGQCDIKCGKGHQYRRVHCTHKDEAECTENKPVSVKKCLDSGPHCTECKVNLFGGRYLDGWTVGFAPGNYNTTEMIARGATCEQVSSAQVHGICCFAMLYEYGDFNRRHRGWEVQLEKGKYPLEKLENLGVENNDVSAIQVWLDETCSTQGHKFNRNQAQPHKWWTVPETVTHPPTDTDALRANHRHHHAAAPTHPPKPRRHHRRARTAAVDPEQDEGGAGSAADEEAEEEAEPVKVARTPPYFQWWFWALLLVVIGGVGYAVYRFGFS
mmetsp:Transcript_74224/g.197967  ORF Transcript_74224/g.197967 Transcript_74224/m.197967 type:complete len:561 (+) Transcript_74224:185-1867(+)